MDKAARARHKAKGLCCHCPRPAVPGRLRCVVHAEYLRRQSAVVRQQMFLENRCVRCNKPLTPGMDDGFTTCLNCREKWHLL
jgi:NMD protein affecting ribosome stability and mRNA decay